MAQLREEFPDDVRFAYRHYPLIGTPEEPFNDKAALSTQAAEAAGIQGKFWEMHDAIFAGQNDWIPLTVPEYAEHEAQQRRTVAALGLPPEVVQFVDAAAASALLDWPVAGGGWWFPHAGWVQPTSLCRAALAAFPERITARYAVAVDRLQRAKTNWQALAVEGPFDFALTGVLAGLAAPLAAAGISIFAISTFDTDWLLVRDHQLAAACDALGAAGHAIEPSSLPQPPSAS